MRTNQLVAATVCALTCSCSGTLAGHPSFNSAVLLPERNATSDPSARARLAALEAEKPTSCGAFDGDRTKERRNECLVDLQTLIDQSYRQYEATLNRQVSGTNFLLNIGTLGVTTAGTASGGETAKTVLSAIATGLTGLRTAISEDILYKASVQTLILQMQADRASVGTRIETRKKQELSDYTMADVRRDLIDYYYAGTITSALASNNAKTGEDAKTCKDAQAKAATGQAGAEESSCDAISAEYVADDASEALQTIFDSKGPPAGSDRIASCLDTLGLKYNAVFLMYGAPAADRNRVLGCLNSKPAGGN